GMFGSTQEPSGLTRTLRLRTLTVQCSFSCARALAAAQSTSIPATPAHSRCAAPGLTALLGRVASQAGLPGPPYSAVAARAARGILHRRSGPSYREEAPVVS